MSLFKKTIDVSKHVAGSALNSTADLLKRDHKISELEKQIESVDSFEEKQLIRKVSILKGLAHKDGDFSDKEKIFLYKYILSSAIKNDALKISLALKIDEQIESMFDSILSWIKAKFEFADFFQTEEEAYGFIRTLRLLAEVDGELCDAEKQRINRLCELFGINKEFTE